MNTILGRCVTAVVLSFAALCGMRAHAAAYCPTYTIGASNVYGYQYNPSGSSSCRVQHFKTLEEAEAVMHGDPYSSADPALELAFEVPGSLDQLAYAGAVLDHRTGGAISGNASILAVPATITASAVKSFVKGWPPTSAICQTAACPAGQACNSLAAEVTRTQCEFQATWHPVAAYSWTLNSINSSGSFGSPTSTTGAGTPTGTFTFTPTSSTDTSHAMITIVATPSAGTNIQGKAESSTNAVSATQSSQSFSWPVSKTDSASCPSGYGINASAGSESTGCSAPLNKVDISGPSFQQSPCQPQEGNPCLPASGNKQVSESGFRYGAIRFDLYYNSLRQTRPYGYIDRNWSHSFAQRVITEWSTDGHIIGVDQSGSLTAIARMFVQDAHAAQEIYFQDVSGSGNFHSTSRVGEILKYVVPAAPLYLSWKLYHADGSIDEFDRAGRLIATIYPDDPRKNLTLSYLANYNGGATSNTDSNHYTEAFWRVYQVSDGTGRYVTFNYSNDQYYWLQNVVADDGTTLLSLGYDTAHRLTSAKQPGTTARQYVYNEPANVFVNDPDPAPSLSDVTGYWLTGIVDENNGRFATYQYDDWGRVYSSWHGTDADKVTLQYGSAGTNSPDDSNVTVVEPLGGTRKYVYSDATHAPQPYRRPQSTTESATDLGGVSHTLGSQGMQYDASTHRVTQVTDARGNITQIAYDTSAAHELSRSEAVGTADARRIETDWDWTAANGSNTLTSSNRMAARRVYSVASDGTATKVSQTQYVYDATTGHMLSRKDTDPVSGAVRTWTYSYCTTTNATTGCLPGYLQTIDGPRTDVTDVTTYAYYTTALAGSYHVGDLHTISDALGHVTTFNKYDTRGQILEETDANGVVTDYTYTPRGWLSTRTVRANGAGSSDAVTRYDYDGVGNLQKVTQPDGTFMYFGYDAAERLTDIWNSSNGATTTQGDHIHYTLDRAGNRIKEETRTPGDTAVARSFQRVYDQLNRLVQYKDGNGTTTFTYTSTGDTTPGSVDGYDPNGNPAHFKNSQNFETLQQYDALNRVISTIQNYNGTDTVTQNTLTQYSYDARDLPTQVNDPSGYLTNYTYDGLGNVTQLKSPDTGTTKFTSYDAAGNLLTRVDARNVTANYGYDVLGRAASVSYPANTALNVTYTYDQANTTTGCAVSFPLGRLTTMVDSAGTTVYCYDSHGNVISKTRTIGSTVSKLSYTYTLADKVASITYPDGGTVVYTPDSAGRTTKVTYQPNGGAVQTLISSVTYYPFGPANVLTFGNGRKLTKTYDLNYAIKSVVSSDANGFVFDAKVNELGNLTGASNAVGANPPTQSYAYDPLNRLTTVTDAGSNLLEMFSYNAAGDRQSKTLNGHFTYQYQPGTHLLTSDGSTSRGYDNNGNLTSAGTTTYQYGDNNRMVRSNEGSNAYQLYAYDGTGLLSEKKMWALVFGGHTYFWLQVRDDQYTYDENGILLDDNVSNSRVSYIYMDGTPIGYAVSGNMYYVETDHLGTPRDLVQPGTPDTIVWKLDAFANNSAFGENAPSLATIGFDLRFAGQFVDVNTGLSHNGFRDYEPSTGRYIESDPLGLGGGTDTYSYARSRPGVVTDRLGLFAGSLQWCLEHPEAAELCIEAGILPKPVPLPAPLPAPTPVAPIPMPVAPLPVPTPAPPAPPKPGDRSNCPDDECDHLNDLVQAAKKIVGSFSPAKCLPGMTRQELQARFDAWLDEAMARAKRDEKCWTGGDDGHQTAHANAWAQAGNCLNLMR